ncbi:MAG: Type IV-A pilus assembly ATPase PilB [Candidatus Magasanikbacteria bacterium GW2011_GWA2_46_17]|uniref:Type IV-A pilus assembly ATPase PilB n=1 Tax=Candidatus Magasanikbacteria bacterium GW2011_GWA2_46_17 TaxID=1619042 RepID=A0A0G1P3D8_9BACT|nr:MAG: Type IV-A pilus assembly ATPase PilB [Candidatus Magasanikbacteria bacterium GW2011_GWA2_46_17]HBF67171.1 hypothetical protein [Candidatus Magasanikbacteria bacterium]
MDKNTTNQNPPAGHKPLLHIASDDTLEKFQSKMAQVRVKEREIETEKNAAAHAMPYIDLRSFPIAAEALMLIPKQQAQQLQAVCFLFNQDQLRLGTVMPERPAIDELLHQLQERHHAEGKVYLVSQESFNNALKLYDRFPTIAAIQKGVSITEDDLNRFKEVIHSLELLKKELEIVSTTDMVTLTVAAALNLNTSDIHIEAEKDHIMVRFRLDGVLQDIATLPKDRWDKIVSRIKLVSALKINVTDKPQDGRFTIRLQDGEIDVRVSILPTVHGESVVMRVLKSMSEIAIEALGLNDHTKQILTKAIGMPYGMIITTGPTGSGKTTTLYAILKRLNTQKVKIITLEDPVEYKLEGVSQSQIDPSKDFTFAKGLRAMLRQDPDIAMVGEIRDFETADTAINAALTGHLILSTIHTNTASGALPRFLSLGVKSALLAPALRAVMGQRLVRKLCEYCKKPIALETTQRERLQNIFAEVAPGLSVPAFDTSTFYGPMGCTRCDNLGYKGRMGIYEIYDITPEMADLISKEAITEHEVEANAIKNGMITMAQDGVLKALQGITSLAEVLKVAE